jgi:molybdopterin-guanine dinucleotide biosynthesis protein A
MKSAADQVSGDVVIFVPCDLPLLTAGSLERLRAEALVTGAAVVACSERRHWSVSAWRRDRFADAVRLAEGSGARSLHAALEPVQPSFVTVESWEVLNVNTIDDLAEAQRYLAHLKHD